MIHLDSLTKRNKCILKPSEPSVAVVISSNGWTIKTPPSKITPSE